MAKLRIMQVLNDTEWMRVKQARPPHQQFGGFMSSIAFTTPPYTQLQSQPQLTYTSKNVTGGYLASLGRSGGVVDLEEEKSGPG